MKNIDIAFLHAGQFCGLTGSESSQSISKAGSEVALVATLIVVCFFDNCSPRALETCLDSLFSGSPPSSLSSACIESLWSESVEKDEVREEEACFLWSANSSGDEGSIGE